MNDDDDVTVLLVDDQERFRAVARAVVDRTPGFRLIGEAVDGIEAVERALADRPAMVLMDIHMPRLDGLDATRRLLADAPSIVVVLLSSYDRDDLPAGTMESGAAAYLHKEELGPAALADLWRRCGPGDGSLGTQQT